MCTICKSFKWLKDFFTTFKTGRGRSYMSECKKCNVERRTKSAQTQRIREQSKLRPLTCSPDPKKQAYMKWYYLKNKEKFTLSNALRKASNPEYYREKQRQYNANKKQRRLEAKEALIDKDCT